MAGFLAALPAIANVAGAVLGSSDASKNRKAQYEFAQKGIQWKVRDAQAAGIHPVYALGAMGSAYSPVTSSAPDFLSAAGQDISRAIAANRTDRERRSAAHADIVRSQMADDMALQNHRLGLERQNLENEMLRQRLARMVTEGQVGPAPPEITEGQTVRPGVYDQVPAQIVQGALGAPGRDPGAITSTSFAHTDDGGLSIVQSQQSKDRTEDDLMAELDWGIRNRFIPFLRGLTPPRASEYPLPPGAIEWKWDWDRQAFYPWYGDGFYHSTERPSGRQRQYVR